jgi:hypothetical protein
MDENALFADERAEPLHNHTEGANNFCLSRSHLISHFGSGDDELTHLPHGEILSGSTTL